jgi:hypothetical protein
MSSPIPRIRAPSYEEFVGRYLYPHQPVVIEGAIDQWRALRDWSPDFFQREFPDVEVSIVPRSGGNSEKFNMRELIDRVHLSTEENQAPYLRNEVVALKFPRLLSDFAPLPSYAAPNWLSERYLLKPLQREFNRGALMELFIGGKGAGFPRLHYDYLGTHAFLIQIYGEKRVIFFAPDQTRYLYPDPAGGTYSLIQDPTQADLAQFPLFPHAQLMETTLGPGDMLLVPTMWWHTTKMSGPSISLSFNLLNGSNWHQMTNYVCRKRSAPTAAVVRAYLHLAGRWRQRRDRALFPSMPPPRPA